VVLTKLGIPWTLENPFDSFEWHTDELRFLSSLDEVDSVLLDQCMYRLRPPDWDSHSDVRVRKRTRILGSLKDLSKLRCMCDRGHTHSVAFGHCKVAGKRVSRTKSAGAYPAGLCGAWAKLVPLPQ